MAEPRLAIVVGANGGIGRALLAALVRDKAYDQVIAMARNAQEPDQGALWIEADILDESSLKQAADRIRTLGQPVRIILATGALHGQGLVPEKSMRALDPEGLARSFAINAIGPALVAKHLLPLTPRDTPSLFAALSARVGSIGDNHLGGWYGYRASKAALNMLVHTLAIEHRRTRPLGLCVVLHPGTVNTDLSQPFQSALPDGQVMTPAQSAQALLSVMDGLTLADNGGFIDWNGVNIPW